MKHRSVTALATLALTSLGLTTHGAVFTDRSAWEAAVTGLQPVDLASPLAAYDVLPAGDALALPGGKTLTFTLDVQRLQVPGSWATWSGGKTPAVLYSLYESQLDATLGAPVKAFGFEVQPNAFGAVDIILELDNGESLTRSVSGNAGAAFFGWIVGPGVQGFTLTAAGGNDFAVAEMAMAVPEPASYALLAGIGLAAFAWVRRLNG